jgi:glycosyltransferase involved in cell wall biosynthesis
MVDLQKFKPPQAATKLGDIPEIIEHRKNGLLIESGDSKSLAAAILAFISNEKLTALCAANGLRYAIEHFSFDDIDRGKASSRGFVGKHKDGKTASCAQ